MEEIRLCSPNSLKNKELCFPNFTRRADDYTKRVLRKYEHSTNNVPLEENRIEENRIEEKRIAKADLETVVNHYVKTKSYDQAHLSRNDWSRFFFGAKKLLLRNELDVARCINSIDWVSQQGYEWTIETVLKKMPDIEKQAKSKNVLEVEAELEQEGIV